MKPFLLNPTDPRKNIWDTFIIIVTTLAAVEIPLRFVLEYPHMWAWDSLFTLFFTVDMILSFFTGYRRGHHLVRDFSLIAKRYLRLWFWIDFLAAMPLGYLGSLILPEDGAYASVINGLRFFHLLRLAHLIGLYNKWERFNLLNPSYLRLIFFIFWISLIAHWMACGWIFLEGERPGVDLPHRYTTALYWSVTTLTTVGYGDITPKTIPQTIYTMFVMILGVGVYGYVIGNVASLLANIDVAKAHYQEQMDRINAFLKYRNIPPKLSTKILNYYNYLWESRLGYDESSVLDDLPDSLKTEVTLHLNRDIIEKVPLFRGASEELIRDLVLQLRPLVATPGDYIFRRGEIGTNMYFISQGTITIFNDKQELVATLSDGTFFGEIALLMSTPRTADVRAADFCDLYILEKEDFERCLLRHPEFEKNMRDQARKRFAELLDDHSGEDDNGDTGDEINPSVLTSENRTEKPDSENILWDR